MDFEKWHALGNDYVIVEEAELPFELTAARVRAICTSHTGVGSDGIVLVSSPADSSSVARIRIFNPDGSEAELSGNGGREAAMYLRRRGWAHADAFSIETAAGRIEARITSATECTMSMGTARLTSDDYPSGTSSGAGELTAAGRTWHFQHVQVGNPQCAIRVPDERELATLDLTTIGPVIERHELFPNRTNVSWFVQLAPSRIRARIFERGAGETASSGTGATGAAVAHTLQGGESPVTVVLDGGELEVDVGEGLEIALTGWAVPVYRGVLDDAFEEILGAAE